MGEFHDLYILPLTMRAPDPVLTWLKVAVFDYLVTVRTVGGERIDGYLPLPRHDDLMKNPLF